MICHHCCVPGMSNDGLVTVDSGGCVRLWETALASLDESMAQWRGLIGQGDSRPLQVNPDFIRKCLHRKS